MDDGFLPGSFRRTDGYRECDAGHLKGKFSTFNFFAAGRGVGLLKEFRRAETNDEINQHTAL